MASNLAIPIDEIARAVSGAVSSVLAKMDPPSNHVSSSDEDFESSSMSKRSKVKKKQSATVSTKKTCPSKLPSTFIHKKKHSGSKAILNKVFTYDRDIVCLPMSHGGSASVPIPKSRSELAKNGLIGKIRLTSDMTEDAIFSEIRSVFRGPMGNSDSFDFDVLQSTGGSSKSLAVPSLSDSFKWTASAIVSKNAKTPLYIRALAISDESDEETINDTIDLTSADADTAVDIKINPKSRDEQPSRRSSESQASSSLRARSNSILDAAEQRFNLFDSLIDYGDELQPSPSPPPMSPITPQCSQSEVSNVTVEDLMSVHKGSMMLSSIEYSRIDVRRKFILNDTLHMLRNGLDVTKKLKIVFVGEPAIDDGGPQREFFYKLMQAMVRSEQIFCGDIEHRIPRHSVRELSKGTFFQVGVIIALSIFHGGPAPECFSSTVADYIVYGVNPTVDDIFDHLMKEKSLKILNCQSSSELRRLIDSEDFDFRFDIGITMPSSSVQHSDRNRIASDMALQFGVLAVKAELDEMVRGMSETFDMLSLIRKHPRLFWPLFVHKPRPLLIADKILDILPPKFSEQGSSRREMEEEAYMLWVNFVKIVEGGKGSVSFRSECFKFVLEDILMFCTGMPYEPPCGFIPKPSTKFNIADDFPFGNTCANVIRLPLTHLNIDVFGWHICFGILNSPGFGKV